MDLRLGQIEIGIVSGGRLWVDGGGNFGVIPKVMWERKCRPDERNRVPLDTNCLLVRTPTHTVLVDTGYGNKCGDRDRDIFGLDAGFPLLAGLERIGARPDDVDVVVLTHLHFDHAGGCTAHDDSGRLRPVFARARHIVQRIEWEDAVSDLPELAGHYYKDDFLPLQEAGLVNLIDGRAEAAPGVTCLLTGGHSRGHQAVLLGEGRERAIYLGDICPTSLHLRTSWVLAYDEYPREVRRIKRELLSQAAHDDWLVLFNHDLTVRAARIMAEEPRGFVLGDVVALT